MYVNILQKQREPWVIVFCTFRHTFINIGDPWSTLRSDETYCKWRFLLLFPGNFWFHNLCGASWLPLLFIALGGLLVCSLSLNILFCVLQCCSGTWLFCCFKRSNGNTIFLYCIVTVSFFVQEKRNIHDRGMCRSHYGLNVKTYIMSVYFICIYILWINKAKPKADGR